MYQQHVKKSSVTIKIKSNQFKKKKYKNVFLVLFKNKQKIEK